MQSHYITASRHCITPSHYTTALRHRITPLRHNTRSTRSTAYTVGRRYKPISFHNRAMRHSRATLLPLNVPQQFCATPLGNALPLFRRWRVRIDPVSNKLGDTFSTLGRHYKPISFPNRAARHPRATLRHFFVAGESALIPPRISSETPSAPLGDITSLYRSTTGPRDTLGRHYCPQNVPQQFCAAPSGNTSPLFRRWRVRIEAVFNKPGDSFSTLGRPLKPISFHNRAMRHYRATFQPLNVPHQFCAAPLGNITSLYRSTTVLRDTLGQRFATFSSPKRTH